MSVPSLPRPAVDAGRLAGRTVDLVRVDPDRHAHALWLSIGRDPALWAGTPVVPFADEAAFADWLHLRVGRADQALFAIVDKVAAVAGLLFVITIVPEMGTAELGLVYSSDLQRRTGGTEAVFLALHHVLGTLEYRRVEWRCNPANVASMRAAARYGFTLEGVLRRHRWIKGANYDTAVHSIIAEEWPAKARRFAAWLALENFDADGRQRTALSTLSS